MILTTDQRIALLREVHEAVTASVESLEHDDCVGPDLAYLLGAILNDTGCAWPPDRAIVAIVRERFRDGHPVHRFIEIEDEGLGITEVPVTDLPISSEPMMNRTDELTRERLIGIVNGIQSILWKENGAWNPDKTWDAETIESVAALFEAAGLRPQPQSDSPVVLHMPITPAIREAAGDALGYAVDDERIADVLSQYAATATSDLENALRRKEHEFHRAGGRGVDLAEEIDALRIALTIRQVAG